MAETSLDSLDLVDSCSDDDDTNPNNIKNEEEENRKATTTRLRIRLHATNLPRQGRRVRKRSPNAHVVVTSVVGGGGDAATTTTTSNSNSSNNNNNNKCWFETETVPHACHPQWTKTHVFEYEYGTQLFFYAHVFHLPSPADDESEMSSMPNISSPKSLSEQGRNTSVGSTDSSNSSSGALFPAMRRSWKNKGRNKRSNEGGGERGGGTSASRLENAVSLGTALFDVGDILGTVYHTKVKRLRAGGCVICRLENAANEFGTPAVTTTTTTSQSSSSEPLVFAFQLGMATKLVLPKEKRMSKWIKLFQSEPDTVMELSKQPSHQQQQRRSHPSTPTAGSQDGDASSSSKNRTVRASSMPRTKQPWVTIWRSQPVLNSSQPTWDGAQLDWSMLCSTSTSSDDDDDRDTTNNNKTCAELYPEPLRISVRVLRPSGRRVEVAMAETTVGTLLDFFRTPKTSDERRLFLQSSSNFQPVGQVQILSAQLAPQSAITATNTNTNTTPQPSSTHLVPAVSGYSDISSNTSPGYHQHHQRLFEPEASSTSLRTSSSSGDLEIPDIVDLSALQPVAPPASFPAPSAAAAVRPPTTTKTFSQYVEQGTQIEFAVAIDFTSSNGDPRLPPSYHYQGNPDELNVYEETIMAIGKVLEQYSTTQQYPVWGFGAKYGGVVRHLFQCGPDPVVHGVNGILKAYQQVFASDLCMSGPTEFLSVLKMGAARAKQYHDRQSPQHLRYMVLLIITDGVMDSFDETQRMLQVYSQMPVSFVFVGVGRASFDRMYRLCSSPQQGRGGVNHHNNNTTFVEFRLHQHNPLALGQAALASIPTQLCQYMQSRGF